MGIKCDVCGNEQIIKGSDGLFTCSICGTKYSIESIRQIAAKNNNTDTSLDNGVYVPESIASEIITRFKSKDYEFVCNYKKSLINTAQKEGMCTRDFIFQHIEEYYYGSIAQSICDASPATLDVAVETFMEYAEEKYLGSDAIMLALEHSHVAINACLEVIDVQLEKCHNSIAQFHSSSIKSYGSIDDIYKYQRCAKFFNESIYKTILKTFQVFSFVISKGYILSREEYDSVDNLTKMLDDFQLNLTGIKTILEQVQESYNAKTIKDTVLFHATHDSDVALMNEARSLWKTSKLFPAYYEFSKITKTQSQYSNEAFLYLYTYKATVENVNSDTGMWLDVHNLEDDLRKYISYLNIKNPSDLTFLLDTTNDISAAFIDIIDTLENYRKKALYSNEEIADDIKKRINKSKHIIEHIDSLVLDLLNYLAANNMILTYADFKLAKRQLDIIKARENSDSYAIDSLKQLCFDTLKRTKIYQEQTQEHHAMIDLQIRNLENSIQLKHNEIAQCSIFAMKKKRNLEEELLLFEEKKNKLLKERDQDALILEGIWEKL